MISTLAGVLFALSVPAQSLTPPPCEAVPGRQAEQVSASVRRGETFERVTPSGWIVRLSPRDAGWFLSVSIKGRESDDLARLTPSWHFVPNPREIEGWHFRNADNTGPNDGSVNAPGVLREFIFSPAVGVEIEYRGSATSSVDVEKVRSFGRGWLYIDAYRLTPERRGERASFESMTFGACLTWPIPGPASAGSPLRPGDDARDALLDLLVFGVDAQIDPMNYPPEARAELERHVRRFQAFQSKRVRPGRSRDHEMVYAAQVRYERRLAAVSDAPEAAALALKYVDALRPCYEWEGYHDCPEQEAIFAADYERTHPGGPFQAYLPLLEAHRWLCAAEGYDYEKRPEGAARSREAYSQALAGARQSENILVRLAARELSSRDRCFPQR